MAAIAPTQDPILGDNQSLVNDKDQSLISALISEGQSHLFSSWPSLGQNDEDKRRMIDQLHHLDTNYAGGLLKYIKNARRLLQESKQGINPFEGCIPSVPDGQRLDFGSEEFLQFERLGAEATADAAFVLVAGGLGERLGYSKIKLSLPAESASGTCFLQLYIESILSFQEKAQQRKPGCKIPLAIMTSDDTHEPTIALLNTHNYFGMDKDQIHILKQEKVACLSDNDAHLALMKDDPFAVQTKPHGHGDVHMLLHGSGLAEKWLKKDGLKWVCFFQDTNGLVFRALPAALGVSETNNYDVNSLAVPRKAKEAIGAIASLKYPDGRNITINVEYNQLDPLLRATINPEGDINDPSTGFSPFPGNINQLVLKLDTYVAELHRHGGVIAEFVNPKYADSDRNAFKSSTRLECMMQDFPKSLPDGCKVGFTVVNQVWAAYSPVKNSPADAAAKAASGNPSHSATTGEFDIYQTNCKMLEMIGCHVDQPQDTVTYNNIHDLHLWPRVAWSPLFASTFDDLRSKINDPSKISIGLDSTLVIEAPQAHISSLQLKKGALVIKDNSDVKDVVVDNKGWEWKPLELVGDDDITEEERIRGFRVMKEEEMVI